MESSPSKIDVCLMCLDHPATHKVGTCHHAYCRKCLSAHMEEQLKDGGEVFPCPACRKKGLQTVDKDIQSNKVDDVENNQADEDNTTDVSTLPKAATLDKNSLKTAKCKICFHKGYDEKAVNVCEECLNLPLCVDCTDAHRQTKFTEKHIVASLVSLLKRDVALCDVHGEPLRLFCTSCDKNICHVCLTLEHGDHDVETLNEVIHKRVDKLKTFLELEKLRYAKLQEDEKYLRKSHATAQDREDALIKEIEDHAECCIEQILKHKETMKKQVRQDCKVIVVLSNWLKDMPEIILYSKELIAEATEVLNKNAELQPSYAEKLTDLWKEIFTSQSWSRDVYDNQRSKYRKDFDALCKRDLKFYPKQLNLKMGGFEAPGQSCKSSGKGPCVCEVCEKMFKQPSSKRKNECSLKGYCSCGTCGHALKVPNADKVWKCQEKKCCQCGTCGCKYDRKSLTGRGLCVNCNYKITLGGDYNFQ